ncbi:hypothetical protein AN641_08525 [Candidatus Epulonipiscioides gigas]|nr:hypothetical protein AN641_08525 [Epulopiscium sp. SCG-C07WGA-EpuloA2]
MDKKFYTIKEASTVLNIEPYVLRYYEKELNLNIFRNSQKHRVFTQENIDVIEKIRMLRDSGIELKAIKAKIGDNVCSSLAVLEELGILEMGKGMLVVTPPEAPVEASQNEELSEIENKKNAFLQLIQQTIQTSLITSQQIAKARIKDEIMAELGAELKADIETNLVTYVDTHMEKIKQDDSLRAEKTEEYYKKVDEAVREMQTLKKEISNLNEQNKNKKSIWKNLFNKKDKSSQDYMNY